MKDGHVVYRLFDDHEEKHYVLSTFDHRQLEELVNKYKKRKEKVYAKEFIKYLRRHDSEAQEVEVKDFYF